jgi:RHS repeat-associated protein
MAEQLGSGYFQSPYKFNGKELDGETGLYYYGARYYDPITSVWLSVDPLATKYPGNSPFLFCHDNPINRIDLKGLDDYEVNNRSGKINLVKSTDDNFNRLISGKVRYDKHGALLNKNYIKVGCDLMEDMKTGKGVHTNKDMSKVPYNFTEFDFGEDQKEAMRIHKWLADNTKVEWNLVTFKSMGNKGPANRTFLSTSHLEMHDYRGDLNSNENALHGNLIYDLHNHSGILQMGGSSPEDREVRKDGLKYSPNAIYEVYRMGIYRDFDGNRIQK